MNEKNKFWNSCYLEVTYFVGKENLYESVYGRGDDWGKIIKDKLTFDDTKQLQFSFLM